MSTELRAHWSSHLPGWWVSRRVITWWVGVIFMVYHISLYGTSHPETQIHWRPNTRWMCYHFWRGGISAINFWHLEEVFLPTSCTVFTYSLDIHWAATKHQVLWLRLQWLTRFWWYNNAHGRHDPTFRMAVQTCKQAFAILSIEYISCPFLVDLYTQASVLLEPKVGFSHNWCPSEVATRSLWASWRSVLAEGRGQLLLRQSMRLLHWRPNTYGECAIISRKEEFQL